MKKSLFLLPIAAMTAACGGGQQSGSAAQLKIVGSSTVYPFTTAVAEEFQRANPGTSVIVESTGTGAGMKLFCDGVGSEHARHDNASRRSRRASSRLPEERRNQVIEFPVGIDGLTIIESAGSEPIEADSSRPLRGARGGRSARSRRPRRGGTSIRPCRQRRSACSDRRRRRARATASTSCSSNKAAKAIRR
jgi:hypothetical protein